MNPLQDGEGRGMKKAIKRLSKSANTPKSPAGELRADTMQCCVCKEKAVAFWPAIDLGIRSHPYCRACMNKAKIELLILLSET